jgi:uncharacterized protein (DUF305 family)
VTGPRSSSVARRHRRAWEPGAAAGAMCHASGPAIALLASVLLAGCGGGGVKPAAAGSTRAETHSSASSTDVQLSSAPSGGQGGRAPHNPADLRFASAMVALGSRAVEAAGVANASSANPLVRALAAEMRRAQGRVVSASAAWLEAWRQGGSSGGSGPPTHASPPGSVGPDDVRRLRHSAGGTLDRLWLQLMSRQERAEARAARAEVERGRSPVARALARTVIARSRVDRVRIRGLLGDRGD